MDDVNERNMSSWRPEKINNEEKRFIKILLRYNDKEVP